MRKITILTLLISILMACPYAFGEEVGRVTYVEGRVDILRDNSEAAMSIREDEGVCVGDSLRTKSNSKIELTFNDKSVLRLAQNSKAEIKDYKLDENNKRQSAHILLERGKARAIISKMKNAAEFVIATPNAEGRVKGSDIYAFYQAGNSGMLVAEGRLAVVNNAHPKDELIVPAGNSVLVELEELPKGPRQYFELEKKLHEQDTNVPTFVSKKEKSTIIKAAVTKVFGAVKITRKGQTTSRDVTINDIIEEGDKIETGDNGMIEIKFDDGNAINLKPNSNILMGKLVFDPATGEYENLFESSAGKIRARIENLKGGSKFEVKTPTAVSGARGTIMYLFISLNLTESFFDGGPGYLANLISGISRTIGIGENASSDANGAVSDPTHTTDSQRESLEGGWDPGSGVEGYSAPEGGNIPGGGPDIPDIGGLINPFNTPPITEINPPTAISNLDATVGISITEVYSSVLTGTGQFGPPGSAGIADARMDINFTGISQTATEGLWAASVISGRFLEGPIANTWTVNFTNETGDSAVLSVTNWLGGGWQGNVEGVANGQTIGFNGTANGTFNTGDRTFEGAGTGTWHAIEE